MRDNLRYSRPPSLVLALIVTMASILITAGIEMAVLAAGPVQPRWFAVAIPCLAISYGFAGVEAWRRRPSNRVGPLLILGSWSWILAGLADTGLQSLVVIGLVCVTLPVAVIVHLILAFPSGRLVGTTSRVVTVTAYLATTLLQIPLFMFTSSALMVVENPALELVFTVVQAGAILFVVAGVCCVVSRRLRNAPAAARRVLAPLYAYGVGVVVFVPATAIVFLPVLGLEPVLLAVVQFCLLAGIPFAFALGLLRGGFARTGEIEELGVRLAADMGRAELVQAVSDALGDPSVQLAFWATDQQRYVDELGRPIHLSASDRGVAVIELADRRIGAIVYDAALIGEAELVATAGRLLAIALDRERLTVELLINRDELRESRTRLVDAADRERRRIARDLHDGVQGRLVLLAVRAQLSIDADGHQPAVVELRAGLEQAIDELRRLVHGVLPALLMERGLYAATEELVDRMTIPTQLELPSTAPTLPPAVESTAYFVVAEGLANALKHSRAARVWVRLRFGCAALTIEVGDDGVGGASALLGSGLRGIADRVDVLGGRLTIDSSAGNGTRLRAELPCES